jgi:hypothetical protein
MRAVLIRDPAEDETEGLRPEAEEWPGERIEHLGEVLPLLRS